MAHIVQFRSSLARTGTGGEGEAQEGAQIIIFPGVRREYHVETAGVSQRRQTREPQRDRLELPE